MSHITLTLIACDSLWEMVQKNSFKNFFLSWFKNLFRSTLDTTIISKMSNTHWHPGKRRCIPLHEKNLSKFWLKILFVTSHNASGPKCWNVTAVSQVTPPAESIKMVQYTRETHGISEEVMRNTCGRHKVTAHSAVTAEIEDGVWSMCGGHVDKDWWMSKEENL